jgi:hypothetical protein
MEPSLSPNCATQTVSVSDVGLLLLDATVIVVGRIGGRSGSPC